METAERRAAAALWCIPGIGPRTIARVRACYGDLGGLLERPVASWAGAVTLPGPQARALAREARPLAAIADGLERTAARAGQQVVFPGDRAWPRRLGEIDDAPVVLFLQGPGEVEVPGPRAALVGTRHPEAGVCRRVQGLAAELGRAGVGVVSGAADGVDQAAHAGALEAGAETWAFLGEGLDQVSGARAELAATLREVGGSLFSPFPPGTPGSRSTFRRRNPLISGASDCVLVVRAPVGSGALITAEAALTQGRPLLAMPGDPWNRAAEGCNRLLQSGQARLCLSADEVLQAVGLSAAARRPAAPGAVASPEAERLLGLLEGGADADALAARAGVGVDRAVALLLELQLAGAVVLRGGGRYEHTLGAKPAPSRVLTIPRTSN